MTQQPGGWYDDPTNRYMYRYWNGAQWTDQVSSSGNTSTDPTALDPRAVTTPPAPGTEAPSPSQAAVVPTVQVTQKSGSGFGTVIGVILAIAAVVVLIIVLVNSSSDDSSTATTGAPATTEAPATTVAP